MAWREETVSLQAETDVVVLGMAGVGGKGIWFELYRIGLGRVVERAEALWKE